MTCTRCRRKGATLVPLPLTGELRAVCVRCRPMVFLFHMKQLLVPHG